MKQIKIVQATSASELEVQVNNAIKELHEKDMNTVHTTFFHSSRTTSNSYPSSTLTTYTCVIIYTQ